MKLFDRFSKTVFTTVNRVMSVPASWISADTQVSYAGPVLFNDPTAKEIVDEGVFIDASPTAEFLYPAFDGLKTRVDSGGEPEVMTVDSVDYYVTNVHKLSDGNNFKAYLRLVNDPYGPKNQD